MERLGTAIDIGTTTVQAQLIDLKTNELLENFSALNNQRVFGADVMSRISVAQNGKLDDLFFAINSQIENIFKNFICKRNLDSIEKCHVSGNTVMLHLFCREDPSSMGAAPYTPLFLNERNFKGKELSLPAENISLLPGISAFVGADIVSGLAFLDIMNKGNAALAAQDALFIDIGTNGEIAVWKESEKKFYCCSTAAGPCFEEAEISCGLNATGFINTITEMKRKEIIDETGALAQEFINSGYPVADGKFITQKDVRQFQLAKSAIFSGIKLICKTAHINLSNLKVYIAGELGYYLNIENAAELGLLPRELTRAGLDARHTNIEVCGNTSLKGTVKSLTDPSFLIRCREIIAHSTTVDLSHDKYFAAAFAHNMQF